MALEFKFFKYFLFKLICLTLNNSTAELYVDVTNINLEISYNYTDVDYNYSRDVD